MKKIRYIMTTMILLVVISCNEEDFLTETPKDFLSPENSYTNKSGFESALGDIYNSNRQEFWSNSYLGQNTYSLTGADADLTWDRHDAPTAYSTFMNWNTFNADNGEVVRWWRFFYRLIFKANTIINRAESDIVEWNSEEEKNAIVAEARFLRAHYYRYLANIWGGVPIILEESAGPKFDFVRASREEVYLQCKEDLTFAIQWMPTVDEVPGGRAPRAAAYHVLAEVNIQLGDYQGAINAASAVIDGGSFSLMTERFGRFKDFEFRGYDATGPNEPWGDVYFDLFREGNMNRIQGNREVIWNCQFEFGTEGGYTEPADPNSGRQSLERFWGGALYWHPNWQRDLDGVKNLHKDTLMGRPISSLGMTDYTRYQIWNFKDDFDRDIRNSKYNIQRTYYWNNPQSRFFGTPVNAETMADPSLMETGSYMPSPKKTVTVLHHGFFPQDFESSDGGSTYKDWYLIRLAETYLLRAEAYHLKGDNNNAAADINAVRNRVQATPIDASEVNLDLILDERARELYAEEIRISTLCRMEKLAEYLNKYNSYLNFYGYTVGDHINLWPIPNVDIEANKETELEQNPGYE